MNSSQQPVPQGFILFPSGRNTFTIYHERTGLGWMTAFLVAWLTVWTLGCVALLREYFRRGTMDELGPVRLWHVLASWAGEVLAACLPTYLLFCKKVFRVDRDSLAMETNVLGLQWRRIVPKDTVRRFIQVKDGGEDEDSFPSWGLKLEGDRTMTLIYRQPYEKSHWLGRIFVQWAGVEFAEAPREPLQEEAEQGAEGNR